MNDLLKDCYKKVKLKVTKKPYAYGFVAAVVLVMIPLLIWIAYFIGDSGYRIIHTSLTVDGTLGFYSVFLTFLGTVALGGLVLWQNRRYKIENDKSQDRLVHLTEQANEISRQLINLEKDKFRPYIKIDGTNMLFAVSKYAGGFGKKIRAELSGKHVKINGIAEFDEKKNHKFHPFYPECIALSFGIENIGQAAIAEFYIKHLLVLDDITGALRGFKTSMDTSLFANQIKQIALTINSQVPYRNGDDGNIIIDNKIYENYVVKIKGNIRLLQIEMTICYKDIYNREYEQEYSFHMQYDLAKETEEELILKTRDVSIVHHVGKSPYGSRYEP